MVVENELYADLIIEDGKFTARSSWLFTGDDSMTGNGGVLEAARSWAGNIGDALKIPAADGRVFSESGDFKVRKIEFEMVDRKRCRIHFTAGFSEETEETGGEEEKKICGEYREERRSDGSVYRIGTWGLTDDTNTDVFPVVGQLFEWDAGSFVCTQCEIDLLEKSYKMTARQVISLMLNGISRFADKDGIPEKEVTWFVAAEEYPDFQTRYAVGSSAEWAGENYFHSAVDCKPFGRIGFEVTLKAREVLTRQLEISRRENFVGFYWNGAMRSSVTFLARYQVHCNDLASFRSLVGSKAEWAEDGMIVSDVQEEKHSAVEYSVTLDACYPKFLSWKSDNDDEYDDRVDYKVDVAELFISAAMAGYIQNSKGVFEPIPDWNSLANCPFVTVGELPQNYINSVVRTMELSIIEYIKGNSKSLINDMQQWNASRLDNGEHVKGNALRIRQTCSDVREKDGTVYAKLTRVYQLPPDGMTWNDSYWRGL